MADFASQAGHWYKKDGTPAYEQPNKSKPGELRATTLRDAKKLNLLPSVTTILKSSAKPGLENWKIEQAILAALTLTRGENEPDKSYVARVRADAAEHGKQAAKKGTEIHGWVEKGLTGAKIPTEANVFVSLAHKELARECPGENWKHERSFATEKYGGKVDLHSAGIVIDIKTNERPVADAKLYDEHLMQLAAYSIGLFGDKKSKAGILLINHKNLESRLIWTTDAQIERGLKMFNALVAFFYAKTGLQEAK